MRGLWSVVLSVLIMPSFSFMPCSMMVNVQRPVHQVIHDYCQKGLRNHKKQCGILIVRVVSSFLPHIEQIGHRVLSLNNQFIQQIMDMDESKLSHKDKGKLITALIHTAQWGDNVGSRMLQVYLDIVKSSFQDEEL